MSTNYILLNKVNDQQEELPTIKFPESSLMFLLQVESLNVMRVAQTSCMRFNFQEKVSFVRKNIFGTSFVLLNQCVF